jgi:AraC-like DNA-binding protein
MINSELVSIVCFSAFLLGLVIVLILIFVNRKRSYPNLLLALCISSFAFLIFVTAMISSGLIIKVPHLFRTASPVIYLVAPTAFLYVRSVLKEERSFNLLDSIHFLPALLHFLELIPFYIESAETKTRILEVVLANPDFSLDLSVDTKMRILEGVLANPDYSLAFYKGILPLNWHAFIKNLLGLIYLGLQAFLIWDYTKEFTYLDPYQKKVISWLKWFTLVRAILYSLLLFIVLLGNDEKFIIQHLLTLALGASLLSILGYLFFQPQILYGISDFSDSENLTEEIFSQTTGKRNASLSTERISDYQYRIEKYLETKKPYMDQNFRMQDMVADTGIPRHHLSALINTVYKKNFNGLINEYRVKYIKENIHSTQWSNFSLEGIGKEAGFKSRSTFLDAFKKETGMTPSTFRKKVSQL